MLLTALGGREAKPDIKTRRLFDGGGLYLEISPSGSKWWRLEYHYIRKEKRLALGAYPEVSLKEARLRWAEAPRLPNEIDPAELRRMVRKAREPRAADSFEGVAREWFLKFSKTWRRATPLG